MLVSGPPRPPREQGAVHAGSGDWSPCCPAARLTPVFPTSCLFLGFSVDCGEIARRHVEDLSGKRLNDVVMLRPSPTSSDSERVTHYCLSPSVQKMARRIDLLKDSHIFRAFWAEAAEALHLPREEGEARLRLDLEGAYEALYVPCLEKFCNLYNDLKSGELTLAEVDTIFKVFVNRYNHLSTDLNTMCLLDPRDPKDWVQERVRQISEYHQLQRAADVAKAIREVKDALGLTGDFSLLHVLLILVSCWDFWEGRGPRPASPGTRRGGSGAASGGPSFAFYLMLHTPGACFSLLLTNGVPARGQEGQGRRKGASGALWPLPPGPSHPPGATRRKPASASV